MWGIRVSPLSRGERQGYRADFGIDPRTSLPHLEVILGLRLIRYHDTVVARGGISYTVDRLCSSEPGAILPYGTRQEGFLKDGKRERTGPATADKRVR